MTDGYWTKGPPTEILEGLVSSGLVKDRSLLPSISQSKPQTKPQKNNRVPASKPISSHPSRSSISAKSRRVISSSKSCQFGTILEEKKLTSDIDKRSSLDLTSYTRFSLPPEREAVTMPRITENTKSSHCTRAQSQNLLKAHSQRIERVSVAELETLSANEQFEIEKKQLYSYLLSFDEAIQATKTYNSDIALILVRVKNFFQNLYSHLPEMSAKYESEIKEISEREQNALNIIQQHQNEVQILTDSNNSMKQEIEDYKSNTKSLECKIQQLEETIADLEYNSVVQKQKIEEVSYRLLKLDEKRNQYQVKLINSETQIEELSRQQYENEKIIIELQNATKKQQKELEKLNINNMKINEELNNANAELQKYRRYECQLVDVGTGPEPVTTRKRSRAIKKSGNNALSSSSNISTSTTDFGSSLSPSKTPISTKSVVERPSGGKSRRASNASLNQDIAKASEPLKAAAMPTSSLDLQLSVADRIEAIKEESPKEEIEVKEEEEKEEEVSIEYSNEIAVGEEKLPPGYKVVELFDIPTITSCTGQLLSLPMPAPDSLPTIDRKFRDEEKSFVWTLGRVIGILKEGIETSVATANTFRDIVRSVLAREFSNEKIIDRVEASLWFSAFTHRHKSLAIQFFMDMAGDVYNILDARYFNIVFSLAFQHIYPAMEEVLGNEDLENDFGIFLIHKSYVGQIASITLKTKSLSDEALQILMDKKPSEYPGMVSFWTAARALLHEFRLTHKRFHQIARNLLMSVGWTESNFVCKPHFVAAMRVLLPHNKPSTTAAIWQIASMDDNSKSPDTVSRLNFLRAIGESKGIAQQLLSLPLCEDYERKLQALGEPLTSIFFFLRDRFTDFIPQLMESLPSDISSKFFKLIDRTRNALLWVDIPTALMYYRTLLQHTDLRMTERSPVPQFGSEVTMNDSERLENHLRMRECLATLRIADDDSAELLTERKRLMSNTIN